MRRIVTRLAFLLSLACLVSSVAFAIDASRIITVDEIRPGMRGYGLTVFRGTEPERFDVEVVDVIHNFRPDQDLVLIRTPHPRLDQTNIVAGMSGSPIYVDGRLLGAYAYGWPYGSEPIAGVTPITNMLAEMRRPTRPDSFFGSRVLTAALPARGSPRNLAEAMSFGFEDGELPDAFTAIRRFVREHARPTSHPMGLEPAATPLWVGGLSDDAFAMLEQELSPLGLVPVQAGGGGARAAVPSARFVDGGAIGVQLVRGDISLMAIGTVTHVDSSGRVLAFGHPMMEQGEVGLPTAVARIAHIMASIQRSFKVGEAVAPLGTLIHDRQSAIVIDTAREPATVPIRVKLHGIEGIQRDEWNVTIASHRTLTPMLTLGAIQTAIKSSASDQTDVSFRCRTEMVLTGYGPIVLEDEGALAAGPANSNLSQLRAFSLFEVIYGNPFVESRIERVDFDITFEFGKTSLQLMDARVSDTEVQPGDEVPILLSLRRHHAPDEIRTIRVRVPERLAGQTMRVEIRGANTVPRPVGRAESFAELVDYVRGAHPPTELATIVDLPGRSLAFPSHVAVDLPPSVVDALALARSSEGSSPFTVQDVAYHPMGAVVVGTASIELHVAPTRVTRSHLP